MKYIRHPFFIPTSFMEILSCVSCMTFDDLEVRDENSIPYRIPPNMLLSYPILPVCVFRVFRVFRGSHLPAQFMRSFASFVVPTFR